MKQANGGPPVRIPITQTEPITVTNASSYDRTVPGGGVTSGVGVQYAGTRNVYTAAGYKGEIKYADVLAAWQREHIAKRLIDIFPDYTWRRTPVIIDGADADDPRDTEFCDAWNRLWNSGRMTEDGDTMMGLDWSIPELDRVAMMGKWAVLFLGFAEGGQEGGLSQPVTKGQFKNLGADGLAYTSVYAEPNVTVAKWEDDVMSPRYGKPLLYNLKARRGKETMDVGAVHWTRVIHVAHNGLANLIEGQSSIDHVFNLLQDLLKVIAGTGESGYRNADPGMVIKTQPAFEAPDSGDAFESFLGQAADQLDESYLEELKAGIESYIHGLERYMVLEGYDVEMLTGAVADPRGPVSTLVDLISGATGIPQRLLLGNEAGELASGQDQANWSSVIETRQEKVAVPVFLRPIINRLVWCGILPEPANGMDEDTPFMFHFPSLYSIDPKVQADVAQIVANVLKALGVAVDAKLFAGQYLPDLDPAAILEAGIPPADDNPFGPDDPEAEDDPFAEDDPKAEEDEEEEDDDKDKKKPKVNQGPVNGGRYP